MNAAHLPVNGFFNAINKYRWHFVFWFVYWLYCYITDLILYDNTYILKEIILVLSHHILLFYSLLYCIRKFSRESVSEFSLGIIRFLFALAIFFALRFFINYKVYPPLDKLYGVQRATLVVKQITIGGTLWVIDYFIKASAYFIFTKLVRKERELRLALEENYKKEKALKEKEIEEERARQVEASYRTLETTFANLVHETKTPLTLINNCLSEHLEKYGSTYELDLVKISLSKLDKDITNLFDLQRLKHEKEVYDHQQICDVSTLVEDNLKMFEYYTNRRRIHFEKNIESNLHSLIDPAAVNRIINNLVENGIKFSPENSTLFVSLTSKDQKIFLRITDQGFGIPENQINNVFIPYLQLNKDKKNIQGMGLGLPLVKSIIDNVGGSIEILNNEKTGQKGTTIIVIFDQTDTGGKTTTYQVRNQDFLLENEILLADQAFDENAPNLLVVEDNKSMNSYLTRKLGKEFNVQFATNGAEAIQRIKDRLPDLIVSDIMMDTMDGFEMAEILNKNPQLNHIPIIFLSAKTTETDKLRGIGLGAVDYMEKPFSYPVLVGKIESILSLKGHQEQRLFQNMKEFGRNMLADSPSSSENFLANCRIYQLTTREIEISNKIVAGLKGKDIADELCIAENTVKNHVRSIYEKVGVNSKIDLVKKLQS
jgi:two-component system sensor histidine kinase ChiS